jgi:hypothetical protein
MKTISAKSGVRIDRSGGDGVPTYYRYWPIAAFSLGATALAAAILAVSARIDFGRHEPGRIEAAANVLVMYLGATDCAPCRTWQRDHWPQFAASSDFKRLAYREVTSPKLFDLLNDDYWPEDLRRYRKTLEANEGVPLWFIVTDGEVALTARGLREWDELALPIIKSLVR